MKFAIFSCYSRYIIAAQRGFIKEDCQMHFVGLVVWVCNKIYLFMDDVLVEDMGIQAWYDVRQLSASWKIGHWIDPPARKPITAWNEDNGTWPPGMFDSH